VRNTKEDKSNVLRQQTKQIDLLQWDGETVFVDRQGNIIKRQPVTAKYYEEDIPFNKRKDQPPAELTKIRMLLIPGGTLLLKDGKIASINPFFMAQTPITQAQWWAIASREDLKIKNNLDLTPSQFKSDYGETSHWLRPVENVNWFDVIEYCGRLAKLTGSRYTLPSESQWEYACYANTEASKDQYLPFHYGETLTAKLANYDSQRTYAGEARTASPGQTTPVGNYPPNAFGLKDMHGNVWEWCIDSYCGWDEEQSAEQQLLGINIRGGSWCSPPRVCCGAFRPWNYPDHRNCNLGFRVVCRFPEDSNKDVHWKASLKEQLKDLYNQNLQNLTIPL
jgi:hypothetical protein